MMSFSLLDWINYIGLIQIQTNTSSGSVNMVEIMGIVLSGMIAVGGLWAFINRLEFRAFKAEMLNLVNGIVNKRYNQLDARIDAIEKDCPIVHTSRLVNAHGVDLGEDTDNESG